MRIMDLPQEQRPRERLLAFGAHTLTDAELLAIVLCTGTNGKSAIEMASDLIRRFGSLGRLLAAAPEEFKDISGLGPAKRSLIQAVLELARRSLKEELCDSPVLQSPQAVGHYLRLRFSGQPYESFVAIFLDMQSRLLACEEVARGTLDRVTLYPREIIKMALRQNAAAVIFAHNHPHGCAQPSKLDQALTKQLKQLMSSIEVSMHDHLIVTESALWSFRENGLC